MRAAREAGTGDRPVHKDRVIVRNLPREFDAEKLTTVFGHIGTIVKAKMSMGLGRVAFDSEEAATRAMAMSGTNVGGKEIKIEFELVRDRKPATGLGEKEAAIVEFGRELFGKNVVSAATYARALKIFGETDLVDLVSYMAQQSSNASILTVFDQHLPADQRPLLAMR